MAIFVYRRQPSVSARALANAVEGVRLRRLNRPGHRMPVAGDVLVCWGEEAPTGVAPGVLVLNGNPLTSKYTDAETLRRNGVSTIEVARQRPAAAPAVPVVDPALALWETAQDLAGDFLELEAPQRTTPMITGIRQLNATFAELFAALSRPAPLPVAAAPQGEWVGRMNNHIGGNDLLNPPQTPDYYSRKLNLREEYRIHAFDGRSIRAGRKMLREGFSLEGINHTQRASPWIRSFDGGWRIVYDNFESSRPMRELAAAAVQALGLTFGAVDIGLTAEGTLVVLEVNRAAGVEGNSVDSYAQAVTRWVAEHGTPEARRQAA